MGLTPTVEMREFLSGVRVFRGNYNVYKFMNMGRIFRDVSGFDLSHFACLRVVCSIEG